MWEIREVLIDHWFDFTSFFLGGGGCSLFDPKDVPIVSHNIAGQVHSKVGCLFFLSLKSPSVLPMVTKS